MSANGAQLAAFVVVDERYSSALRNCQLESMRALITKTDRSTQILREVIAEWVSSVG